MTTRQRFLLDRANRLYAAGAPAEAYTLYRQLLDDTPDHPGALRGLGLIARDAGRTGAAIDLLTRAAAKRPGHPPTVLPLADLLRRTGNVDRAVAVLRRARRQQPNRPALARALGVALRAAGDTEGAVAEARAALALNPDDTEALANLGVALTSAGRPADGAAALERAVAARPENVEWHYNLATTYIRLDRLDAAVAALEAVVAAEPDHHPAWANLGIAHLRRDDPNAAEGPLREAVRLAPGIAWNHYNLAWLLLLTGRFGEGFAEYAWRRNLPGFPAPRLDAAGPEWDGTRQPGATLLLHAEQGFGDTIQFVRYAAPARERVGRVVLACQRPLVPLLAEAPGVDAAQALDAPLPAHDVRAAVGDLPRLVDPGSDSPRAPIPYLTAPAPIPVAPAGDGPAVGLVWAGGPRNGLDRYRSLPDPALLAPLLRVPGIRWVSLQLGERRHEIATLRLYAPVTDAAPCLTDFGATAAVVAGLDLVVSVDTAMAHVAGALGPPARLLLSRPTGLPWGHSGAHPPWYPHVALHRQPTPGDWATPVAELAAVLQTLVQRADF